MTTKNPKPREFNRGIPGLSLQEWNDAMRVARPLAEERVKHGLRSLGGKKTAIGDKRKVRRAVRAEFPDLIAKGIPAATAIGQLALKYKRTKSIIRRHVANLR